MEQTGNVRHIPELDGIRGMAVLSVMLFHFHSPYLAARPLGLLSAVIARGFVGVDIFFVLSGFLITSILLSTRNSTNYFQAFYARRAVRIFPLAFISIALFYWVAVPLAHRHGMLPKLPETEQIWYWLFLGNWRQGLGLNDGAELGHFWSLAIEEQFYILFALVVRYVAPRRIAWVCVGLITASVLLRAAATVLVGLGPQSPQWLRLTPLHLDPIALGALLACSGGFLAWAARWRWPLLAVGVLGLTFHVPQAFGILLSGLGAVGLVAMAVTRPVALFRMGWLRSCGKYSYAMYVLHPAWMLALLDKKYPASTGLMWTGLLLGPLVSYGLAVLSWNLLEKHFLALKRYFPYEVDPTVPALNANEPHIVVPENSPQPGWIRQGDLV